jgi:hypothetical protein
MGTSSRVGQLLQLTEVIQTEATCDNCFVQSVASTAANSLHELAALFPRFRADSGRSVQQAAESAEVSPPLAGKPTATARLCKRTRLGQRFGKCGAAGAKVGTAVAWRRRCRDDRASPPQSMNNQPVFARKNGPYLTCFRPSCGGALRPVSTPAAPIRLSASQKNGGLSCQGCGPDASQHSRLSGLDCRPLLSRPDTR